MEHQAFPNPEARKPATEKEREQLLRSLPDPELAAGVITMALSDDARESYFNALSESRDIDPLTARLIAYNVIAHAPEGAETDALRAHSCTGEGSHAELRAEYLPLYQHPIMPAEGRLLLDALGTHLFHHEHPTSTTVGTPGYALDGGLFYTDNGEGERVAVAFQLPMGLALDEAGRVIPYLERAIRRYGDPFRAFLRLPGVDAASLGLVNYYLGVHALEDEADALLAQGDPERRGAIQAWEAVEIGGQLHVFTR
ncbi:MAG: hypothetical protein AB7I38_16915 [Dehalococcoidia bacterium]